MKKEIIFYTAITFALLGFTLLGLGIGTIFCRPLVCSIIGFGTGLIISAFALFRVFRRIDAYEKK